MKAEVRGSVLSVWVDNKLLFDRAAIQTAALQESGAVGVRSYGVPVRTDDVIWSTRAAGRISRSPPWRTGRSTSGTQRPAPAPWPSPARRRRAGLRWRVVSWDDGDDVIHHA